VLGALATLAPTALVASRYWLGFDRYLYLPAILVVAAALPLPVGGRRAFALAVALALGLGAATFVEARKYRSPGAFTAALLRPRPDEPTGYLVAAANAVVNGRRAEAQAILARMPVDGLPPAVAHIAAALLYSAGRPDASAALVERAVAEHPGDATLETDLLTV